MNITFFSLKNRYCSRAVWQARHRLGVPAGDTLLLFGCRNKEENHFSDEQDATHERRVAFSREQGVDKKYVTDLAMENGTRIRDVLIRSGGALIVCGGVSEKSCFKKLWHKCCLFQAKMALDMKNVLKDIFEEELGCPNQAAAAVEDLRSKGRYQEEVFG